MNFYLAGADNDWFNYLSELRPDEVNFWQPGGNTALFWAARSYSYTDLFKGIIIWNCRYDIKKLPIKYQH
jgi:hypothetical protein